MKDKIIIILIIFLVLIGIFSTKTKARETRGNFNVSVEIVCNCPVNGVIVPIHEGVCVEKCKKLQESDSYGNLDIKVIGDQKIITY